MTWKRFRHGWGLYLLIWVGYVALYLSIAGMPGLNSGLRTLGGSLAGVGLAITLIRQRHYTRYNALIADLKERQAAVARLYDEVRERERLTKEAHTNLIEAQGKDAVFVVCAYTSGPEDPVDVVIRQEPGLTPGLALQIVQTIGESLQRAFDRSRAAQSEWN